MRNRKRNHGSCIRSRNRRTHDPQPTFDDMIAPHLGCEKGTGTLACAARCELHTVLAWPGSVYSRVVCTERRNKRSQMGSFQARAICTRVHDGAYCRDCTELRNFLRPDADAFPSWIIAGRVRLVHHAGRGKESSLFQLRSITAGQMLARFIFQSSRNCPPLLFSSTLREGEAESKRKKKR